MNEKICFVERDNEAEVHFVLFYFTFIRPANTLYLLQLLSLLLKLVKTTLPAGMSAFSHADLLTAFEIKGHTHMMYTAFVNTLN